MPIETLLLIGAGGHAKVVYDALRSIDGWTRVEIRDDDPACAGQNLMGVTVAVPIGDPAHWPEKVHVAIGDNWARRRVGEAALAAGKALQKVVHPSAIVSPCAQVGFGTFLAAVAVVAPAAQIGPGVIVNHGAIVDHDCRVGAWSHIAPNAVLGGDVHIGEGCLVGAGAVILPGISVGNWVVVGAGAVVTVDIGPDVTVAGVPARVLTKA